MNWILCEDPETPLWCLRPMEKLAQVMLSQEAYGILLLPLHSNRIDCCLSLSCVRTEFVEVVSLTDHDASFRRLRLFQQWYRVLRKLSTSCCHSAMTAGRTPSIQIRVLLLLFTALLNTCVVDIAALLDRAADRFSACMDTKVDSMMDRLEKRIDEKIDSKLGPVMDRLSVLEKTSSSTISGHPSLSDNGGSTGQSSATGVCICSICSFLRGNQGVVADFETETHMAWRRLRLGRLSLSCDREMALILTLW